MTTSAYSNSSVLQGHEPLTSATLSVGLTTRPHWPFMGRLDKMFKEMTTPSPVPAVDVNDDLDEGDNDDDLIKGMMLSGN